LVGRASIQAILGTVAEPTLGPLRVTRAASGFLSKVRCAIPLRRERLGVLRFDAEKTSAARFVAVRNNGIESRAVSNSTRRRWRPFAFDPGDASDIQKFNRVDPERRPQNLDRNIGHGPQ